MPQTDPTKKKKQTNEQNRDLMKSRLVILKYQIGGNTPVLHVLWFQWKHPSHWIPCCLCRTGCLHVIQFSLGSINNFCEGDVDAIKTISGVLKVDHLFGHASIHSLY